jgi:hypothetical protein
LWLRQRQYCFAGLLAWNAAATTSGAAVIGAKSYSPIIMEAGCRLNGPLIGAKRGTHQVCKKKDWMLVRSLLV